MAIKCETKFGELYAEEMPMNEYALMDSDEIVITYYDNDMPIKWLSDDTLAETNDERKFFNLLAQLLNCFLIYDTSKSNLIEQVIKSGYSWYESEIEEQIFRVGKHYFFVDFEREY